MSNKIEIIRFLREWWNKLDVEGQFQGVQGTVPFWNHQFIMNDQYMVK